MADENNTVVKTVQNVDRMFAQIVVNGEVHNSENYVAPSRPRATSSSPSRSIQGEDIYGVELNDTLHDFVDRAVSQGLVDEATARQFADNLLQTAIDVINALIPSSASTSNKLATSDSVSTLQNDVISIQEVIPSSASSSNKLADSNSVGAVQASVSDIEALIPAQATSSNKLADKDFVNSSISTNTANFLGTYTSLADIEAIQNPTNNDYAFLQTTDSAGNTAFDRYKYNAEQDEWLFEYELNNSSFTAEQWATINSGLTSSSIPDAIAGITPASIGAQPAGNYANSIRVSGANNAVVVLSGSGGEIGRATVNNVAHAGNATDATNATNATLVKLQGDGTTNPDTGYSDSGIGIYKATNYNIGWMSNDGMIIHIPWSAQYAYQIAVDDQSDWIAVRSKAPSGVGQASVWSSWDRLVRASELKASTLFKTMRVNLGTITFSTAFTVNAVHFTASAPAGYVFIGLAGVTAGHFQIYCTNEPELTEAMLGNTSLDTYAYVGYVGSGGLGVQVELCLLCMKQY